MSPWTPPDRVPAIPVLDGERAGENVTEHMALTGHEYANASSIEVPANLLARLNAESRAEGLPHLLPTTLADRIDVRAKHALHHLTRIHRDGRPDFFRCQVEAHLEGSELVQFHVLDLTPKYVGTIVEAVTRAAAGDGSASVEFGSRVRPSILDHRIPRWAGSHSFTPVLERTRRIAQAGPLHLGVTNPIRQVLSITESEMLQEAHVIRVDPEQVEVLPEWESDEEAVEFGLDAQLPFETVYLDFEGPGGHRTARRSRRLRQRLDAQRCAAVPA